MANFFRHVQSGDRLTVLFRYHKDQADLEVTVLDGSKKLAKHSGVLASVDGYSISVGSDTSLYGGSLTVSADNSDAVKSSYRSSYARNTALAAFLVLINKINNKPLGDNIPDWLGEYAVNYGAIVTPSAELQEDILAASADQINDEKGAVKSVDLINKAIVTKNDLTLATGGQLVMSVAGLTADDIKVSRPKDKKAIVVIIAGKDGAKDTMNEYALNTNFDVKDIKYTIKDGVFDLSVSYDMGDVIAPSAN